jgi:hypothetical protein
MEGNMRGLPFVLRTKHDVENCVHLAQEGKIDRDRLKEKLQAMLSTQKHYVFDKFVDSPANADGPEPAFRVVEEKEGDVVKYAQFKLVDNPSATFIQAGLTKEELENFISQL